ncbi:MAG: hypothetical protein COV74_04470 [Candidatus Omnitrophica bacterium CG11_big_fil_rev_8_21_14_0_20_45_26]|uniref:Sulfatase-modifying factor enzyme-like domain-containing protein n=1 Tax=Candidatus Abzuiibacterium crystallinum TaxID=1974748 RepID=A0A2H0LSS2_9BACT|nr:MAG: hypothetical protein COV74_04470 [Candidatus Omnitrophica bacterium CG11_big_fil_rev_8_21_14_0_20_45_26]PIW64282.1 MAG: hypothetical protein COW12_06990 [Candidatus Omnitrophica bacterium CG12_big_fil_rev_8_21_14_0_65_45_16]
MLDQSDTGDTVAVEFDISWDNAWHDSINHDAAWVFIKYQCNDGGGGGDSCDDTNWHHVKLKTAGTNPTGFNQGSGTALDLIVPNDKMGVFIKRTQQGTGSVSTTDVQVIWDYSEEGNNASDTTVSNGYLDVDVFGIEMVYVPQGGFYVGDGTDGSSSLSAVFEYGRDSSLPPAINSEDGIDFSNATQDGWYYNTSGSTPQFTDGETFSVSESFPKGFNAYYIMKYEVSEGLYVSFLNSLTRTQQNSRTNSDVSGDTIPNFYVMAGGSSLNARNTIQAPSSGNGTVNPVVFTSDRSDRATGYLNWPDMAAFLDWAALRPYTEFEYEKACRGPLYPVPDEGCWGTTSRTECTTLSGTEDGTETCSTSNANINMNNTSYTGGDGGRGPLRAGIYATSSVTSRERAGAGYYGVLQMADNLFEWVVTVGNSWGIRFTGTHGDGKLNTNGYATNTDWPGMSNSFSLGVKYATGSGVRGSSYSGLLISYTFKLSNRAQIINTGTSRVNTRAGRGARTAP